jgi:AcrR family transcriptional regulator
VLQKTSGFREGKPLVAQVKKAGLREAILAAAFDLFSRNGYTATPVAAIARMAGMTVANLYVYFPSKLALLYEVYRPWLEAEFQALRDSVLKCRSPRARIERILTGLWSDIPTANHSFANTLIEALATKPPQTEKSDTLLRWSEAQLTLLLRESLPEARRHLADDAVMSHIMWMAFDGFAINRRIGDVPNMSAIARRMTDLLLGTPSP